MDERPADSKARPNAALPLSTWPAWLRWPTIVFGFLAGSLAVAIALFLLVAKTLEPNLPLSGDLYALNRPPSLTFLDKNGKFAGLRGAILGEKLKLAEMPSFLPAAFVAMEDRNFYHHHGIDIEGMIRAAIANFKAGHVVQGGSTITQQVVKIVFLTPDRTISRKLQEIAGAWALEDRMSKQQILELYLNRLYLGSGAYGVDGAAHIYFGKSARDVTIAQAAMLAALTSAPSAFSPRRDLAAAQERAGEVLNAMVDTGAISERQAAIARAHPATVIDQSDNLARNYFLDAAADEVKQVLPAAQGDLTVSTTLDPALEAAAKNQVSSVLARRGRAVHATQAALVSMTTDGAVRALIGGRDYAESAFNRVTHAHRQPGSAFKAFVYLAAFEHGLDPATVRVDQPITIKDANKVWSPDNYGNEHFGPVTLEQAFAHSINTIAVQLGQEVGIPSVVDVAHRLGIQSKLDPYASLALGTSVVTPLELTGAYASFATLGMRVTPYIVTEVQSSGGQMLYQRKPVPQDRVFSEANGLAMNDLMWQVVQAGTGRAAALPGHDVAGKTGTSADFRDAWFIGFSPELVTGVWVGNDDFSPMRKVVGGSLPAQIWNGFMQVALRNTPPTMLPRAEPVSGAPEMAQIPDNGDNPVQQDLGGPSSGGLGGFLDDLFGNNPAPAAPPPRQPAPRADNGQFFFPPEGPPEHRPGSRGNGNTSSNGGPTNGPIANGNSGDLNTNGNTAVEPPPDLAPLPPPRARNFNEYRRFPPPPPSAYGNPYFDEQNRFNQPPPPPPEPPPQRYGYQFPPMPPVVTPRCAPYCGARAPSAAGPAMPPDSSRYGDDQNPPPPTERQATPAPDFGDSPDEQRFR
jgi:penicillin-binding protein 1A